MTHRRMNIGDNRPFRWSFFFGLRGYFGLIAAGLLLTAGLVLAGLGYHMMTQSLEASVERRVDAIGRDIKRTIGNEIRRPAQTFLAASAKGQLPLARTREERTRLLPLVQEILRSNSVFGAIVISYDNGHIFMAKLLHSERERLFFGGPPESAMLALDIRSFGPRPVSEYSFYDSQSRLLSRREDDSVPEVRVGLATGQVLSRMGDVFGTTVNLASRLTAMAKPGGTLVDPQTRAHLADDSRFVLRGQRGRPVRGFGVLRPYVLSRGVAAP